ncbi:T9SS sorting signal type C domain-containing protein [Flavobacterium pectinovorum]|uniref:T9SS C-terminal target domain-containing protein n=1 Tax=Flavobacterium pectinovorum TaxID=29533 RepID=A0A502EF26_9FLAO|nr:T9SS sorting signal type C domain-containing protein [Flavobacterium pectinovorum]TPG36268.1 T9SS C-terminal target domain-containing protein [Flavobacterium pectinovorum]
MIRKLLTNKKLLLSLVLFFTFFINYGQSASSYCFLAKPGSYTALTGTTNVPGLSATDDEAISTPITLPFNFTFGGSAYNQVKVSSNGWLTFGSTTNAAYSNTSANAGSSKPILFPLWDDLQNRTIPRYVVSGSAPNRVFKLEWSQQKWDFNANNDVISFQVWLYETTNVIEYYYNRGGTAVNNGSASIGIYDSNDTYLTLNNSSATPTAQPSTFTTNISTKPVNGQIYSFTPSVPASQAGPDQYSNNPVTLAANAPGTGNTGTWSIASGPNTSTSQFTTGGTTSPTATFTPSGSGTWALNWTISNGCGTSTDQILITNCSGNLITNGDFSTLPAGSSWTAATAKNNGIEINQETTYFSTTNGDYTAELDSQASLRQGPITVIPGLTYKVSFLYAKRPGTPETNSAVDFRVFEGATVTASGNTSTSSTTVPQMGSFTFTPTSSSIYVEFYNNTALTTYGTIIDNIVLLPGTQDVPVATTIPKGVYKTLTSCVGTSIGLDVDNVTDPSITYSWSVVSGLTTGVTYTPSANVKNPTITFSTSGLREFRVVASKGGCSGAPSSTFVKVLDLPTVYNVTGGGPYCSGGTGVLVGLDGSDAVSSTSNISYQLQRDGVDVAGAVVTGTGSAISFGLQTVAGTYTVVAKNTLVSTACSSNMNGSPVISISTPPTVSITGSSNICVNGTTKLSPTTGGTWVSNNPSIASVTNGGDILGLATGTATFTFTNTAAPNCSAITAVVNVSSSTIVFDSSTTYIIPAGVTNIQVECWGAGGGGGGSSNNPSAGGGGAGGSYVKNLSFTVTPNSTYTINVGTGGTVSTTGTGGTGGSSWFGSTTTILAVGGRGGVVGNSTTNNGTGGTAVAAGNVGGTATNTYGAAGGSANLTGTNRIAGNGSAGANGGAMTAGTTTNGNGAAGTAPGGGGAGGRNTNGTSSSGGVGGMGRVTITLPTPTASAGGNQTICQTGTALVSGASATNGTILWSHNGSGSLSNATTLTPTYTPASGDAGNTVTLTMTVSNGPCLSATATYNVVVTPTVGTPTAVTPAATTICQGSSNTTYTTSATNATSYTWTVSGSGNTISGTGTTGTVTWAAGFSGSATISVVANGCGTSSTVSTTVNVTTTVGTPTAVTPAATTICQGSSNTTYTTSATNATSYTWTVSGSGNTISGTGTTGTVTWAAGFSGSATISVVANGCGTSSTVSTTVNVTPTVGTPTAVTPAATTICQGSSNTTYTTSATNATSYTWTVSGSGNTISGTGTTGTVTWAAGFSGSATISVVANGCGTSSTVSTTVNVTPTVGTPTAVTPAATTICQGSSNTTYTTSATNATSYTWTVSGSGNTISGTGTTGTVTWAAGFSGLATISVKANGCGTSSTVSTTVTVTPTVGTPTAVTPAATTICQGSSNTTYTTSATNATSYTWTVSGSGNTISGTGTTGTVTWAAGFSGSATISVVANGCGTSSTVSTTVTVTPTVGTPTAITPATTTICQGSSNTTYTTSATNATSYTWTVSGSGNTISGAGTTGTVTWAAGFSGSATISVVANGCGTSSTVSTTVTVTPTVGTPTAVTPAATTICQGSSNTTYTTSATNATSYTWTVTGAGNTISGTGTTGTVTWAAGFSGSATISVKANGCSSSSTVSTTVTVTPTVGTPTAVTPATTTICQGSSNTTYTTSATNATSYTWTISGSGNTISGTGTTGTVTWAAGFSGSATISVVANGCGTSSTVSTTVTVTPTVGTPTAVTPAATTICQGSSNTTYTTSATNATSYTWTVTGAGNTISGTGTTGTVTWAAGFSGSATISVVANGCGTSSTVSTTVNVTPTVGTPTAVTPAATTICQGSSNTTYTTSATNATSYTWTISGSGNTISGTGTTGTVTWAAGFSGSATISVVANGCGTSSTVSTTVNVTPTVGTPTAVTPAATTICQGSSNTTYTTSATNATSYTWTVTGAGNTISGTGTTGTVTWAAGFSGSATISVKANGCSSSSTVSTTVTVTPNLSAVAITPTGGQALCLISSGTLLTVAETGGGTITPRQWGKRSVTGGTITPIASATAVTFTPTGANLGVGNWLIVCTSTPSCGSPIVSNEVSVTVSPDLAASVSIAASPSGAICAGTSVTFTATATNGGTTPTYQWFNGLTQVGTGSTYSSSTLANNDAIKVVMTSNASPCLTGSPATSNTITMTVNALPSTPITGTVTQPTCASSIGKIPLSNLPSGTWTITQGGSFPGITYTGTGSTYNVDNLAPGNYTFTVQGATNTCSSLASANVVINTASSKTWTGIKDSNWSDPANWNPSTAVPTPTDCVVIPDVATVPHAPAITGIGVVANAYTLNVNSNASLTVNSKNTLKVVGIVTVATSGSLIFQNDASLVQTTNAVNIGNIIYNRDTEPVRRYDFTYWSTPIVNSAQPYTLHDLSPNTLLDKYNSYDAQASAWDISLNGTRVMVPAVGYTVRAPQTFSLTNAAVYPAVFTGVPNNGDYSVPIYATKWSLVGNPYPSAIDADELININHLATPSVDVGSLYFWTHNSPPSNTPSVGGTYDYTSNDYAVYNLTGSTGTGAKLPDGSFGPPPTGEIAACQSFFMKASISGNVQFTNGMRIDGRNDQFYKTKKSNAIEKNRLWLNFTNAKGAFKQALVGYIEGATNDWDVNYDATSMNGNSFIDFYSINEALKLSIQGRAIPFVDSDRVPLGYKTTVAGDFTIAIDHADGLFNNQAIYLEDKVTGTVIDLRAANYTFTTAIGTFVDRFTIAYTKKTLGTGDFENLENSVFVSIKDKTIKVTATKETIKEVTIYDINGQLLYNKKKVGTAELQIPNLQSSNQVLLVKVTLENDFTTTKKIIFQ